jgi:type I restriction enzyme, S subunit
MAQIRNLKTGIKYKDTPIGKIPVDWEVAILRNIASKFYNGGTPDTRNKSNWDGNIPWITGADFEDQKVKHIRRYITEEGVKNSATNIVPKGNLLVVTRTGVGKVAIAPFDIAISQDITGVILDSEKALTQFIYWYLDFNSSKLRMLVQGTSINGLLREDLETIYFSLPSLSEQKRIAEILIIVDGAIEKTTQIIEKTNEVKKGLMRELLNRGIGHKKFKKTEIGEIPVGWEVGRLSDIAYIIMGQSPPGSTYNTKGVGCPILNGPTEFTNDYPIPVQFTTQTTKVCKARDILFCVRGSSTGRMNIADKEYCIGRRLAAIRERSIGNTKYIYYTLLSLTPKIFKEASGAGSTFPNISSKALEEMKIVIPSINEQKQIAEILCSIDTEIVKESHQQEQLELFKQGLMQVLLTGKIRVTM